VRFHLLQKFLLSFLAPAFFAQPDDDNCFIHAPSQWAAFSAIAVTLIEN
jgi:hypothetical protein